MKALIAIVILVAAAFLGWKLYEQWEVAKQSEEGKKAVVQVESSQLPGMASSLEQYLEASRQKGATGLHDFLTRYGHTIKDPRLGSIELDYVVLVARENPVEAKKVFARVKKRTPAGSLLYDRVKQLEKTYE